MSIIIRLQNLPWSASAADVREFFRGLTIPEGGVHIVGGSEGDAFIQFANDEDARLAMRLDSKRLKESKVRLLLSSHKEMHRVIEKARSEYASGGLTMNQTPAASSIADDDTDDDDLSANRSAQQHPPPRRSRSGSPRERSRTRPAIDAAIANLSETSSRSSAAVAAAQALLYPQQQLQQQHVQYPPQTQPTQIPQQPQQQQPYGLGGLYRSADASSNAPAATYGGVQTPSLSFPNPQQQQQQQLFGAPQMSLGRQQPQQQIPAVAAPVQQYHHHEAVPPPAFESSYAGGAQVSMPVPSPSSGARFEQQQQQQQHFEPQGYGISRAAPPAVNQYTYPAVTAAAALPQQQQPQLQAFSTQAVFNRQPPIGGISNTFYQPPPPQQQQTPIADHERILDRDSRPHFQAPSVYSSRDREPPHVASVSQQQFEDVRGTSTSRRDRAAGLLPAPMAADNAWPPPSATNATAYPNTVDSFTGTGGGTMSSMMPPYQPQQQQLLQQAQPFANALSGATPATPQPSSHVSYHMQQQQQLASDFPRSTPASLVKPFTALPSSEQLPPSSTSYTQPLPQSQNVGGLHAPSLATYDRSLLREDAFMDAKTAPMHQPPPAFNVAPPPPHDGPFSRDGRLRFEPNAAICAEDVPKDLLRYGAVREFFSPLVLEGPDSIKIQEPAADSRTQRRLGRVYCRFNTAYEAQLALRLDNKKQNVRIRLCSDQEFDAAKDLFGIYSRPEELASFDVPTKKSSHYVELSNIAYKASDADIWQFVSDSVPRLLRRRLVVKNGRAIHSDTAYLEYATSADADAASRLFNKRSLYGRPVMATIVSEKLVAAFECRVFDPRSTTPTAQRRPASPPRSSVGSGRRSPLPIRRLMSPVPQQPPSYARRSSPDYTRGSDLQSRVLDKNVKSDKDRDSRNDRDRSERDRRDSRLARTPAGSSSRRSPTSHGSRSPRDRRRRTSRDRSSPQSDAKRLRRSRSRDRSDKRETSRSSGSKDDRRSSGGKSETPAENTTKPSPPAKPSPESTAKEQVATAPPTQSPPDATQNKPSIPPPAASTPIDETMTCLRVSGLGPSVLVRDLLNFFQHFHPNVGGVRLIREPRGTAYVEFDSSRDCEQAYKSKNRQYIGSQIVTLQICTKKDMMEVLTKQNVAATSTVANSACSSASTTAPPAQAAHPTTSPSKPSLLTMVTQTPPPSAAGSGPKIPPLLSGPMIEPGDQRGYGGGLGRGGPPPFMQQQPPHPHGWPPQRMPYMNNGGPGRDRDRPVGYPGQSQMPTPAAVGPLPLQSIGGGPGPTSTGLLGNKPMEQPNGLGQNPPMPVIEKAVVAALGEPGAVCFLHNLPARITLEEIVALFGGEAGGLVEDSVRMHYSHQTGQPTGDCLLAFVSANFARKACDSTNGSVVGGRQVKMWVVPM